MQVPDICPTPPLQQEAPGTGSRGALPRLMRLDRGGTRRELRRVAPSIPFRRKDPIREEGNPEEKVDRSRVAAAPAVRELRHRRVRRSPRAEAGTGGAARGPAGD